MESQQELRQRTKPAENGAAKLPAAPQEDQLPAEKSKGMQLFRLFLFVSWFLTSCLAIHVTQLLGAPLYFFNKDYYYAYMAFTKQAFGIVLTTITQWFAPTIVRVSGDHTVKGQLKLTEDGRLETNFPDRMVLISNHQLYTDWLYLWWIAYTGGRHGHIFIMLRDNLRFIPIIGFGMMFYGFIFMARNWAKDESRLKHRLQQLKAAHQGPLSGSPGLDPMWLMLFPEGTNLSANTRKNSAKWAAKQGIPDFKHTLLPRSTGLHYCLSELRGTVDWVYDCTTIYEGTPKGGYAQDHFTLRSTYFAGRPPKSVNMYWRRIAVSSIPLDDKEQFEQWMLKTWQEKEDLLEYFEQNGTFPADEAAISDNSAPAPDKLKKESAGPGYLETQVKLKEFIEIGQIWVGVAAVWGGLRLFSRLRETVALF